MTLYPCSLRKRSTRSSGKGGGGSVDSIQVFGWGGLSNVYRRKKKEGGTLVYVDITGEKEKGGKGLEFLERHSYHEPWKKKRQAYDVSTLELGEFLLPIK